MDDFDNFISILAEKGGPEPSDYHLLNKWFQKIGGIVISERITREKVKKMWAKYGDIFTTKTMQGFALVKPNGYAGDYEMIDKIYTEYQSTDPELCKWDRFFHWNEAPKAVRNRKQYFINLLAELENSALNCPTVLNVGCGPSRDVYEYHIQQSETKINFVSVDMDPNAIAYSKKMINRPNIEYVCQNIFRFRGNNKFDIIWSAGLFDYLDDRQFKLLLRKLAKNLNKDGSLVIGNFSTDNPSRNYMEFIGEWYLNHRSEHELIRLADESIDEGDNYHISVECEPCSVNLFLMIKYQPAS